MKILLSFTFVFILLNTCYTQDCIYKKDNSIQKGKIIEVTTDKIKFKKIEIPNGPTFEILLKDVVKIKYHNGYVDILDTTYNQTPAGPKIASPRKWTNQQDTTKFSMLYIIYNDGQDESREFPIYFNGTYICTLRNHMKLTYKVFSYGQLFVERILNRKAGPGTTIEIKPGKSYGISIREPYPQALTPEKMFRLATFSKDVKFTEFWQNEFNKFIPFKSCDLHLQEDIEEPITQ